LETTSFAGLGLSAKVLSAIEASGYTTPTPIQAQAIPVAMTGTDVLGIAQTGTGKTASFVLPMIARLESGRARARMPRSLILAPTRELAAQVAQSFEKYGQNHKLAVALLIGGVSMDDQVAKLDRGVDVLIATPGRLLDHFGRGRIMLMGVEILVIDEADRMLDMGFIPDIEKICKLLPPKRQTLFFSATMPPEITRLVDQFLKNPVRIEVARPATTAKTITQLFQYCPRAEDWEKRELLRNLIRAQQVKNAIIFCNRKRDVAILYKSLSKHGFNAGELHGDMDQMSRTATLDKFRAGDLQLLVASDVAARGLDIPDVSHVFNFDVPWQADDYVHRIGRTGRAGKEGVSATIVTPDDVRALKEIEKITGEPAVWLGDAPSDDELAEGARRKRGRGGRGGRPGASTGSQRDGQRRDGRRDGGRDGPREQRHGERPRPEHTQQPQPAAALAHSEAPVDAPREARRDRRPEPRDNAPRGHEPRPDKRAEPRQRDASQHQPRQPRPDRTERQERSERHSDDRAPRRERTPHRDVAPPPIDGRPHRPDQGEKRTQQQRQDRAPRPEQRPDSRNEQRQQPRGDRPIGFGDTLPAFLRKPARVGS
jgi:superfamily II DNA/RNA helicase